MMMFKKHLILEKTESMIMVGHKPVHNSISKEAYKRMILGEGSTYKEMNKTTKICEFCITTIKMASKNDIYFQENV